MGKLPTFSLTWDFFPRRVQLSLAVLVTPDEQLGVCRHSFLLAGQHPHPRVYVQKVYGSEGSQAPPTLFFALAGDLYIISIMPKIVDHNERRRALTTAAIDVIAQRGLDNVRLVDIARAADVTTGALTHYFDDKDQLIAAALDEVIAIASARATSTRNSLFDMLSAFLPVDPEGQRAARVWLAFFGRAIGSAALADIHRQYYQEFQTQLVRQLEHNATSPPGDHAALADAMIAVVDGILVRATLDPAGWPASKQLDHLEMILAPLLGHQLKQHEEEAP